ncbi:MAG: hypothetical protein NTW16_00220 [Bacteroidetes bacterium]|nr:hypothetical protein [Bacteroidota bacterium]
MGFFSNSNSNEYQKEYDILIAKSDVIGEYLKIILEYLKTLEDNNTNIHELFGKLNENIEETKEEFTKFVEVPNIETLMNKFIPVIQSATNLITSFQPYFDLKANISGEIDKGIAQYTEWSDRVGVLKNKL